MPEPALAAFSKTQIHGYVLTGEIGRGAHGAVYRGYREGEPDRELALKVIGDSLSLESVLLEPEMLSRLQHESIVRLEDYFLESGKVVLVMELVAGRDLQEELAARGRLPAPEVITFLFQMASALAHAHQQEIVHGDFKLSNVRVGGTDGAQRFVLVDFGVSRIAGGLQHRRSLRGTYQFMAPEQLRGRPTQQSDLWALGATAYALLTGRLPFEGEDLDSLSKEIFFKTPMPPGEITGEPAPDLERILFRLLEKDLLHRYSSADEVLADLQRVALEPAGISSFRSREEAAPGDKKVRRTTTWEEDARTSIRKSWTWVAVLVALSTLPSGILPELVILGGAALFYLGLERERSKVKVAVGLGLILLGNLAVFFFLDLLPSLLDTSPENVLVLFYVAVFFYSTPLLLVALYFVVKARRLQRDLFLLETVRLTGTGRERLLDALKTFVDLNTGDLNVREKYIEALLAASRTREAIVEAKLMLEVDPYNFAASLLLAHGYFEAGLLRECLAVCKGYLAQSGQCFEFSDLAARCESPGRVAA